ncbi:hypothetical protein [Paenibacillus polymyxa]|uniref:hypothetical protein n=1 Tax=Paenibacillus polymyxa TaxID=1406 RepID=UPI002AB356E7|nr:hypothetical protein [Paenibacillus polymyxa]MDY8023401.1 hypothetical protein [Paenibacillus polymyxa]
MTFDNNAAMGYTIIAMEQLGYDSIEIQRVINRMYRIFDSVSVEKAKDKYNKSNY